MADEFLELGPKARAAVLRRVGQDIGRAATVLEKDVFLCWTLRALFTMPDAPTMAFKGGTSLSKVYKAIDRFSEDVDITIDHQWLSPEFDPFSPELSNNQRREGCEALRDKARALARERIVPYLRARLAQEVEGESSIEWDDADESLRINYPSALPDVDHNRYMASNILVEFGGRNTTQPMESHIVQPYMVGHTIDLFFPSATVAVLAGERTFWEKATLIHVECHRSDFAARVDRKSRHWYDLARLADHEIGIRAMGDTALLSDVVKHKKVFFASAQANYDLCTSGALRLLPQSPEATRALAADYRAMIDGQMFDGEPMALDTLLARLQTLQDAVNSAHTTPTLRNDPGSTISLG